MCSGEVAISINEFDVSSVVVRRDAVISPISVEEINAAVVDDLKNEETTFSVISLASSEADESEMPNCRICLETVTHDEFSDGSGIRLGCK